MSLLVGRGLLRRDPSNQAQAPAQMVARSLEPGLLEATTRPLH